MKQFWRKAGIFSFVLAACAASFLFWAFKSAIVTDRGDMKYFVEISPGMTLNAVLAKLSEDGTITSRFRPKLVAYLLGVHNNIKAGRYDIPPGLSSKALIAKLVQGRAKAELVTIPEGLPAREIAQRLAERMEIDSTAFMSLVNDSSLVRELAIEAPSLEGFLFPETYAFQWGVNEEQIIRTMVAEFNRRVGDALRQAETEGPYTFYELLTLASIIEGEAIIDAERPLISAVYHNRLRKGMLLQADPTIQYLIEDGPRRLLNRDLEIDSPYNTYRYAGLPPGPINNPGSASISASIFPADAKYLYFVAAGNGYHKFSNTLAEHLSAKAEFDRIRREVRKRQRTESGDG